MLSVAPIEWTRLLLAAAVFLKGSVWPGMPLAHRLLFLLAGLGAMHRRWARASFAAVAIAAWSAIASGEYYRNHFYLLAALTALAAMARWDDEAEDPWVKLMMVQVTAVYFWAGVWKINAAFLSGSVLLFEWESAALLRPPSWAWLAMGLAAGTIVLEIGLAGALWMRSLASYAAVIGIVLHLGMTLTVGPDLLTVGPDLVAVSDVAVFALLCISTYPLFLARAARQVPSQPDPGRTLS